MFIIINFFFKVIDSVKGIIEAKSAYYLDELESMSSAWDGEVRLKTKYDNLYKLIMLNNFTCNSHFSYNNFILILNDFHSII